MMLCGALGIFLTLPFVVRLRDLPVMALFTYILPLFPLMMLWDGVVSCLHEYSVDKLEKLNNDHQFGFKISYETKRSILYPAGVTAITLIPKLR